MLETDDSLPACECPGHLDRILHGFGTAVDQERPLRMHTGGDAVEAFGQLHVRLIGGHWKADVSKSVELVAHRLYYCRMAMTGIHDTDPATEINQLIAVGIGDNGTFRVDDRDRSDRRHTPGYGLGPPRKQSATIGAGDLRQELDDARHLHPEGKTGI